MNCPSCGLELHAPQAACPRCGDQPGFGPDTPESPGEPSAADAAGAGLAFGSPQQYLSEHRQAPVTAYPPVPPSPPLPPPAWQAATPVRRRRLLPVLVLALALLLTGGGVAVAGYQYLGWFGGGAGPAEVLPGSAIGYLQVDLDPSLAQQASAWQFLRELPEVQDAVAAGSPDPKAMLWRWLDGTGGIPDDLSFEADVKPWLGDRIGVVAVPRNGTAVPMVALQVVDEARASTTLREWARKGSEPYDVTARDGFVLLTSPDDTTFLLAELDRGSLAADPTFTEDFGTLGDPGILAGWADLGAAAALQPSTITSPRPSGRGVAALRFGPDTLEIAGTFRGLADTGLSGTVDLGELPASTQAAFGFAGGADAVRQAWPSLEQAGSEWLTEAGLDQDDLAALLGSSLSVGLSSIPEEPTSGSALPVIGIRVVTDDADRAEKVLERLAAGPEPGLTIEHRSEGGVLLAATTRGYLDELAGTGGRLSGSEAFGRAVPDHASAVVAGYLDVASVVGDGAWVDEPHRPFVRTLRGAGLEYVVDGSTIAWSTRLVRS